MVPIKRKLLGPDCRKYQIISEATKESSERQISERRLEHKAMAANHHAGPFQAESQKMTENHASCFDTAVNARLKH